MNHLIATNGNIFIFIGGIWIAGLVSFFSPCIFPVLPVYFGILSEDPGEGKIKLFNIQIYTKPIMKTLFFIGGLSTVFVLLGFGAGALGSVIQSNYLPVIMGIIVIILGLHQMEIFNFSLMQRQKTIVLEKKKYKGFLGAYLLGFTFSFGWTPCIGPVLSAILAITLTGNQALVSGALMGVYTLGLAIPFLMMSILSGKLLKHFSKVRPHMEKIKKIGGLLIVIMGVFLLFDQLNLLTNFFTTLFQ